MFHCYFERKNDKALTFNIVHVHNFEISTSLLLASLANKCRKSVSICNKRDAYYRKYATGKKDFKQN